MPTLMPTSTWAANAATEITNRTRMAAKNCICLMVNLRCFRRTHSSTSQLIRFVGKTYKTHFGDAFDDGTLPTGCGRPSTHRPLQSPGGDGA